MKMLVTDAVIENTSDVINFVTDRLASLDCSKKAIAQISMAIDEIFSNIAKYAYNTKVGSAAVRTEILDDPLRVVITFLDQGTPFDPFAEPDPDINIPVEERGVGGLGILLVKKSMDEVSYEYVDGHNVLTIIKNLH